MSDGERHFRRKRKSANDRNNVNAKRRRRSKRENWRRNERGEGESMKENNSMNANGEKKMTADAQTEIVRREIAATDHRTQEHGHLHRFIERPLRTASRASC